MKSIKEVYDFLLERQEGLINVNQETGNKVEVFCTIHRREDYITFNAYLFHKTGEKSIFAFTETHFFDRDTLEKEGDYDKVCQKCIRQVEELEEQIRNY